MASARQQSLAEARAAIKLPSPGRHGARIRWSDEEHKSFAAAAEVEVRTRLKHNPHLKIALEEIALRAMAHMPKDRQRKVYADTIKAVGPILKRVRKELTQPQDPNDKRWFKNGPPQVAPHTVVPPETVPANNDTLQAVGHVAEQVAMPVLNQLTADATAMLAADPPPSWRSAVSDAAQFLTDVAMRVGIDVIVGVGESPAVRKIARDYATLILNPRDFKPELDSTVEWVKPKINPKPMVLVAGVIATGTAQTIVKRYGHRLDLKIWRSDDSSNALKSLVEKSEIVFVMTSMIQHAPYQSIRDRCKNDPDKRMVLVSNQAPMITLFAALEELAKQHEANHPRAEPLHAVAVAH